MTIVGNRYRELGESLQKMVMDHINKMAERYQKKIEDRNNSINDK